MPQCRWCWFKYRSCPGCRTEVCVLFRSRDKPNPNERMPWEMDYDSLLKRTLDRQEQEQDRAERDGDREREMDKQRGYEP